MNTGKETPLAAMQTGAVTDTDTGVLRVNTFPPPMHLARAYVPVQLYGKTYPLAEALEKGTLFPELYRPYPY